jgi:UDP-glucuronate 4-epimerase
MALYKFTDQIVNGEKTTLYNNGSMRRDFTYVQDIVDGIELVINKIVNDTEEEYHEIYNLGYGESVHLEKFVKEIEKNLGINADIEYAPKHPADAVKTWADISKMKSIGYNPKVPVEIGVQKFVEWYKKIL